MLLNLEPITAELGVRVHISPADVLGEGVAAQLLAALDRHHVLLFPEVHMDDDTFLALTAAMGEMHELAATHDGSATSNKGIFRIARDKDDQTQREFILGNDYWHMDGMNNAMPVKATLLKCQRAPSEGGDTGFANLHAAWAALPAAMQREIDGLRVGHCLAATLRKLHERPTDADFARWDAVFSRLEHPLVWHKESGDAALLIGSTANDIAGKPYHAGRLLLDDLLAWCTQDRFTYRHAWRDGDLVIFHNSALLHKSYPYPDDAGRLMHRTTLKGTTTTGADAEAAIALY